MAGKLEKQNAEEFEANLNYASAIKSYKRAADYFSMENLNSKSYEQACQLKLADLLCISDDENAFSESKVVSIFIYL